MIKITKKETHNTANTCTHSSVKYTNELIQASQSAGLGVVVVDSVVRLQCTATFHLLSGHINAAARNNINHYDSLSRKCEKRKTKQNKNLFTNVHVAEQA